MLGSEVYSVNPEALPPPPAKFLDKSTSKSTTGSRQTQPSPPPPPPHRRPLTTQPPASPTLFRSQQQQQQHQQQQQLAPLPFEIPPPLGPLRLDTVKLRLRTAAERAAQGVPAFVAGRQSHSSGSSIGSLSNSVGGSNGSVFTPAAGGPAIVLPYRPPRSNSLSLSCYGSESLPRGIDPTLQNSNGQTAKDLITRDTPHARELNQMLSERLSAVEAVAVRDFCDLADPKSIAFRCGERLTVLERAGDIWKGYVTSQGLSRAGYFPGSAVQIQTSRHQPEQRPPSGSNDASTGGRSLSVGSTSHPPLPSHLQQAGTGYFNHQAGRHSEGLVPCAIPQLPISTQTSAASTNSSDSAAVGIGAPSPPGISGGGSGNRNSAASLDSGRSSSHTATSCDSRVAFALPPQSSTASNSRLASTSTGAPVATSAAAGVSGGGVAGSAACTSTSRVGGSQDSGLGPRQSLVSTCSSGSLGSLPDDANSSVSSSTGDQLTVEPPYNPADWHRAGLSSEQQLEKFLNACQFGLYLDNFQEAGYDLATLIRCTPEDLNAVGLTDPKHRKRLRQELVRLANSLRLAALPDSIEEAAMLAHPMDDVGQFCQRLGLSDCVADCLRQQGFALVQDLANMAWEDLEEIGVSKLGHQKKLMVAIDRLKRPRSMQPQQQHQHRHTASSGTCTATDAIVQHAPNSSYAAPSSSATEAAAAPPQPPVQQPNRTNHQPPQSPHHRVGNKPIAKVVGQSSTETSDPPPPPPLPAKVPPPPPKRVTSMLRSRDPSPMVQPQQPPQPQQQQLNHRQTSSRGGAYENAGQIETAVRNLQLKRPPPQSQTASVPSVGNSCSRSNSAASVASIPFANENCGTVIRHKQQQQQQQQLPNGSSPDVNKRLPLVSGYHGNQNGNQHGNQHSNQHSTAPGSSLLMPPSSLSSPTSTATGASDCDDSFSNLDDICDMLSDLQSMLDKELREKPVV